MWGNLIFNFREGVGDSGFVWEAIALHRQCNLFYLDNINREFKAF